MGRVAALCLSVALLHGMARAAPDEAFSLEGTPESLAAEDVVRQGEFFIVLDRPGAPDSVADGEAALRDRASGRILAVRITGDRDPLRDMSEDEVRGLRGVRVGAWSDAIAASLARLDMDRTCVTVTGGAAAGDGKALPPLPPSLRYLVVDEGYEFEDLSGLRALPALRLLAIRGATCPLSAVASLRSLRVLRAECAGHEGDPRPDWPEMRWLDLSSGSMRICAEWPTEISFLQSSPALRHVDLSWTPVADLTPLDGHPDLETIDASCSQVSRLPRGALPRLSSLDVFAAPVPAEEDRRFRAEHPRCRVTLQFLERLREETGGADRLEIRPRESGEAVFEVAGRAEVEAFIGLVEVDEASSRRFHSCFCLGTHGLRFYRGDRTLALLSYHHGQALRWCEWPGDADLTERSARAVAEWFAAHGSAGPLREWAEEEARRRLAQRRASAIRAVLPADLREAFDSAQTCEEFGRLLADRPRDPAERVLLLFRIAGCDEGTWNRCTRLDEIILTELLPAAGTDAVAAALRRLAGDGAAANGAARWLFEGGNLKNVPPEALDAALPAVAAHALAHPRARNRRRTILALGEVGTPAALGLLGPLSTAPVPLRPLPESEREEWEGTSLFRNAADELDLAVPDADLAALVLVRVARRSALDVFARLDLPDVAGRTFVRLDLGERTVHGFRLGGGDGRVELLTDDLRVESFLVSPDQREVAEHDFAALCVAFLAVRGDDREGLSWSQQKVAEAALLAHWCRQRGDGAMETRLLAFADKTLADWNEHSPGTDQTLPEWVRDRVATRLRCDALAAANDGAPRRELLAMWRRIGRVLAGHDAAEAEEMVGLYETMIAEDEAFREPAAEAFAALPPGERAKILLYRLRDVAEHQWSDPGQVSVFGMAGRPERSPENAATELVGLGFDAVPLLIEHLDDRRPTRCVGWWRHLAGDSWYLLRVGDACREVLEEVTGLVLYVRATSWGTMSSDGAASAAKLRAQEWWEMARALTPAERFTALLESPDPRERAAGARRLAALDPGAARVAVGRLLERWGVAARPELLAEVVDLLGREERPILRAGLTAGDLSTLALVARALWRAAGDDEGARLLAGRLRERDGPAPEGAEAAVASTADLLADVGGDFAVEALAGFVRDSSPVLRGEALRVAGRVADPRMLAALVAALDDRKEPDRWRGYPARWCDLAAEAIRQMLEYGPAVPRGLDEEPRDAYIEALRTWLAEVTPALD